jgi:uncharacterized protein (TIGR03067 family)
MMIAVLLTVAVFGTTAGLLAVPRTGEKPTSLQEGRIANLNQGKKEKADKELLQGTWVEETRGADAEKVAEDDRWKLVFDENTVTWTDRGKDRQGIFTVDSERKPKEIDLTLANPTLVLTGIYELKGDTLKTLWRENDRGGLPKTFDAKEGFLIVLRKKKAR